MMSISELFVCNLTTYSAALVEAFTLLFIFPCPLVLHDCLALELGVASSALLLAVKAALNHAGAYFHLTALVFFLALIAAREHVRSASRRSAAEHQAELETVWQESSSRGDDSSLRCLDEMVVICGNFAKKRACLLQFRPSYVEMDDKDMNTEFDRIRSMERFTARRSLSLFTHVSSGTFTSYASLKLSETKEIACFDQLYAQGVTMQK
eukprot:197654-Hanusia_phi.AAC.1